MFTECHDDLHDMWHQEDVRYKYMFSNGAYIFSDKANFNQKLNTMIEEIGEKPNVILCIDENGNTLHKLIKSQF